MNQLSLELAQRLGDHALVATQVRAEHAAPGFTVRAAEFMLSYLRDCGPTSGELLTDLCKAKGITAPDDRAYGAAFKSLARREAIRQCGWCERRKGHGTGGGRVWEAA